MRLTLAAALPLLARYAVQGACTTDPRVLIKINEARERLMTKPQNWKGKTQRFIFCSSRACITLPREIETVEAASVCNSPQKMRSQWYDILEGGPGTGERCGGDNVIDRGDGYVSFADLSTPRNIRVYADVPESSTARLLLQGFDENGNRVRTWDETANAWVDGEYVGINNETPQTSLTVFSMLEGIQKPETNGFVRVYAFTAGSSGHPATDITTIDNWDGTSPAIGGIQWSGAVEALEWLDVDPAENLDLVLQFFFSSGVLKITVYDINGNQYIPGGLTFDGYNWTEELIACGDQSGTLEAQTSLAPISINHDMIFELSCFPDPTLLADTTVTLRVTRVIEAAVEGVADYLSLMSILHPDETLPSYRRYELPALRRSCAASTSEDDDTQRKVIVMGKLRYLPVKRATDFLVIENLGALKHMLLAINEEEKGDLAKALGHEAKADEILALELRNHVGDAATANQGMTVQMDAWSAASIPNLL